MGVQAWGSGLGLGEPRPRGQAQASLPGSGFKAGPGSGASLGGSAGPHRESGPRSWAQSWALGESRPWGQAQVWGSGLGFRRSPGLGPGCGLGVKPGPWGKLGCGCRASPRVLQVLVPQRPLLSSPVLAAEVVKFFFPAMVQLHSFVPASSTPQKLANWGHLNRYRDGCRSGAGQQRAAGSRNPASVPLGCRSGSFSRKVLSKLNFSVPNEAIRQIVQCRPGAVEQVLLLLRQKIEEKQTQVKAVPGPAQVSRAELGQECVGSRAGTTRCCRWQPSVAMGTIRSPFALQP